MQSRSYLKPDDSGKEPDRVPDGAAPLDVEAFLGDRPTRRLEDWRALWERNVPFPIRSHRGVAGRLVVAFKRLLRPFVALPQNDLWERQRVFNLVLLQELERCVVRLQYIDGLLREGLEEVMRHDDALFGRVDRKLDRYRREADERTGLLRDELNERTGLLRDELNERTGLLREELKSRLQYIDRFLHEGLEEVMRHDDALFGRVDRKLDRYRREADETTVLLREGFDEVARHDDALFGRVDRKLDRYRREADELIGLLRSALTRSDETADEAASGQAAERLRTADAETGYFDFEHRFRGDEEEIRQRMKTWLPLLRDAAPVLDLGCGRGEALALLQEEGIDCRGIDASAVMVRRSTERGLRVEQGDLLEGLAAAAPGSLGAVVSFHVIEHLPPAAIDRLVRLAFAALRPGGTLLLETPNPLSIAVTARSFWLDPTHVRPVHPEALRTSYRTAGFAAIERRDLHPFPERERLPEISLDGLDGQPRELADRLNRLRDELDDLLHGFRDYAMIGQRPAD